MAANHFVFMRSIRLRFADLIKSQTIEGLNKIPSGFRNNLAWNLGHIVVSTDLLCYCRTGVEPAKEIPQMELYRNGTIPEKWISQEEVNELLLRLSTTIDSLEQDYLAGKFSRIVPVTTATFGVETLTIEELLENCALHDCLHWGTVVAMQKLIN